MPALRNRWKFTSRDPQAQSAIRHPVLEVQSFHSNRSVQIALASGLSNDHSRSLNTATQYTQQLSGRPQNVPIV